jgi:16S rRNA (cytosine1402-N4)-methyltransferase
MSSEQPRHAPVLLNEVVRYLAPTSGGVYVDATAGLGGHAASIASALGPSGTVILNDVDAENLSVAAERLRALPNAPGSVSTIRGNFASLPRALRSLGLKADMLLADLGFASNQMDTPLRGFSFQREGPLDMRLDQSLPTTAADLVASLSEVELVRILRDFGEERNAPRIAKKIVQERSRNPIGTTAALARLVRSVSPPPQGGIDPATRTFQALRIAVNDELGALDALLSALTTGWESWLAPGARVGIISFHSLEDRLVKRAFARLLKAGATDVSDGVIEAGERELACNPRARSARMRVVRLEG